MAQNRRAARKRKRQQITYAVLAVFIVLMITLLIAMINIINGREELPASSEISGTSLGVQTGNGDTSPVTLPSSGTVEPSDTEEPSKTEQPPKTEEPPKTEQPPETVDTSWKTPDFKSNDDIITFTDSLYSSGRVSADIAKFSMEGLYPGTLLKQTESAGDSYKEATVYIGDSTTLGLKTFKKHPHDMVYGFGSLTYYDAIEKKVALPDGTEGLISEGIAKHKPARIVITLGMNGIGLSSFKEKNFLYYFGKFIDQIKEASPNSEIIIQSVTPVTESHNNKMKYLKNERINRCNLLLCGLAEFKGVYFLNTAEVLKNEKGHFRDDLASDAEVHHNQKSYDLWFKYLKEHATTLQ